MNVNHALAELSRLTGGDGRVTVARPRVCAEPGCPQPAAVVPGPKPVPGTFCAAHAQAAVEGAQKAAAAERYGHVPPAFRGWRLASRGVTSMVAAGPIRAAREALGKAEVDVILLFAEEVSGAGKTALAAAMANTVLDMAVPGAHPRILEMAKRLRWVDAIDLGSAQRDSKLGGEPPILVEAIGASFLVIDELGRETGEQGLQNVFEVINKRHQRQLKTVVTCGLSWEKITKRYDQAMIRRLNGAPQAIAIDVVSVPRPAANGEP